MKKLLSGSLVMAALLLTASLAQAALVSAFDSNKEGWTMTGDVSSYTYSSSGGNPGGYIRYVDAATGSIVYFNSPNSWDGNWTGYIGGNLSFDLKLISGSGPFGSQTDIIITGPSLTVSKTFLTALPSTNWSHYEVSLTAASFGATPANFANVMANVTSLRIRGEFINGNESEGLDNVMVTTPLPGAFWLMAAGLLGLVSRRRQSLC